MSARAKTYLGDAVYAEVVDGELVLTTEDGLQVTNRIVLEAVVWQALRHYMGLPGVMHAEQRITCEQKTDCTEVAPYRIFWPGNPPTWVCVAHLRMAQGIADAMGFYLHIETTP